MAAEVMEITPNHPVYVEGKGWVKAEALAPGDRLRRAGGGWARVLALERVVLDAPQMVYNLTVRGTHTYFVLEVGVLVHNCLPTRANGYIGPPTGYPNNRRIDDPPLISRRGEDLGKVLENAMNKPSILEKQEFIFAIEETGNIRVGDRNIFKHSELVKGANVYGAGEIHFSKGQITHINAISGHYSQMAQRLEALMKGQILPKFGPQFKSYLEKLLREKYNLPFSPDVFDPNTF